MSNNAQYHMRVIRWVRHLHPLDVATYPTWASFVFATLALISFIATILSLISAKWVDAECYFGGFFLATEVMIHNEYEVYWTRAVSSETTDPESDSNADSR